jgi:hypothetical protein
MGRSVLSDKMAWAAKFRKNHGMGRWHGVCVRPVIMIDRVIWVARRAVARVAARRLRRRVARLRQMPRPRGHVLPPY